MIDLWFAALLDASANGLALCLAALAVTATLRRASAATRHLVWRRWQRRHARPVEDAAWTEVLDSARADLGIRRAVELVEGGDAVMPMTWGWRRPVVLVPAGSRSWPVARRRAVLLHELAHVARGDYLTQLVSELARALHWWNPLVWMAAGKLRLESEHACDDQVLTAGARASDYAGDLLDIARSLRALRATAPAGLAMARPSELTGRLLAVLDPRRNRRSLSRRLALLAWLAAACVVVPLAALAPAAPQAVAAVAQAVPAPPAPPKKPRHVSVMDINGTQTFEWRDGDKKIKIRTEGKIELNEDWTSIVPGSWDTEGGNVR